MKEESRIELIVLIFLLASFAVYLYAAEQPRWSKTFTEDATASTYTFKWDVDGDGDEAGETRAYSRIMVYNGDSADVLFCDANSHDVTGTMTQNTAVNDASKSTSVPIPHGWTYTFMNLAGQGSTARTTISCICTSGQTCADVVIVASDPVE